MKQRKPLQRHTPMARGTTPLKRTELKRGTSQLKRTPMPRRSAGVDSSGGPTPPTRGPVKPRIESSEIPQSTRLAAYARDEWRCMRCGIYIPDSGRRWGLQHRRPRQKGGSRLLHTMPNLVLLCGWTVDAGTCTEWVELLDRTQATAEGWLLPHRFRTVTPEEWPVLRWTPAGPEWQQPGDTWKPAAPHSRQVELEGGAA